MKYIIVIAALTLLSAYGNCQVKDSLSLSCPLQGGTMKSPSKEGYGYKGDVKIIITSPADTTMLSPVDGKVDLITLGEGGRYELVMHHKDYNIWLIGMTKVVVKKNEILKKGQLLGKVKPGDEIELLLFNNEEPIEPKKFLNCKQ